MFPKYFLLVFIIFIFINTSCNISKTGKLFCDTIPPTSWKCTNIHQTKSDTIFVCGVKIINLYNDSLIYNYLSGKDIEYDVIYSIPINKANNIFFKN